MIETEIYIEEFERSVVRNEIEEWFMKYCYSKEGFEEHMRENGRNSVFGTFIPKISFLIYRANKKRSASLVFDEDCVFIDEKEYYNEGMTRCQVLGLFYYIYTVFNYPPRKKQVKELLRAENYYAYLDMQKILEKRASILGDKNVRIINSNVKKTFKTSQTTATKKGRPARSLSDVVLGTDEDRANIIENIKKQMEQLVGGPQKAKYLNELVEQKKLSAFPSYNALCTAGIEMNINESSYNNALKIYRNK